jgi:hypothetical protein
VKQKINSTAVSFLMALCILGLVVSVFVLMSSNRDTDAASTDPSTTAPAPRTAADSKAEPVTASAAPTTQKPTQETTTHDGESNQAEKEAVALNAVQAMTTWTPGKDLNTTAGEMRARQYMTAERAKEVVVPVRGATDEGWLEAIHSNSTSVPTVELDPNSEGPRVGTWITVRASWTWKTPEGTETSGGLRVYYLTLSEKAPYLITDYTYEDLSTQQEVN